MKFLCPTQINKFQSQQIHLFIDQPSFRIVEEFIQHMEKLKYKLRDSI